MRQDEAEQFFKEIKLNLRAEKIKTIKSFNTKKFE